MTRRSTFHRWSTKFQHAIRGVRVGIRGQDSFYVHVPMALLVAIAAVVVGVNLLEWCVLVLCICVVLATELYNSALEQMAKAVTDQYDERIRDALDIASGAVLLASLGAAVVGAIIFIFRLGIQLSWWGGYLIT